MGCCICNSIDSDFGTPLWSDPQQPVWTDPEDGKEYCAFHAPAEHKGMSVDDFNALVRERIQTFVDQGDAGAVCNLQGVIFPDGIHFSGDCPLPTISFKNATFLGEASFLAAEFLGMVSFDNVTFGGMADFLGATFRGESSFNNATFETRTNFVSTNFLEKTFFRNAKFQALTDFYGTRFEHGASFRDVTFEAEASFFEVTFGGKASFQDTVFEGEAKFWKAVFEERTDFLFTTFGGGTYFYKATFGGDTSFSYSTFGGNMDFSEVRFEKTCTFQRLENTPEIRFSLHNATVAQGLVFFREWADMSTAFLDFTGVLHVANIHFDSCPWPEENTRIKFGTEDDDPRATLEFYRRMKRKYKSEFNEREVSRWHIAEKETQRNVLCKELREQAGPVAKLRSIFFIFVLNIYRYFSGFGEDPFRASGWLLLLLFFPLLLLAMMVSVPNAAPVSGWVHWNVVLDNWLNYIPFAQSGQWAVHGLYRVVTFVWQLLILIQAILLGIALRNRFRR